MNKIIDKEKKEGVLEQKKGMSSDRRELISIELQTLLNDG
mgnify:CR=1 FL=1